MLEILQVVLDVAIATFIAGALFTAGLEVTLQQVFAPLKDTSSVARTLLANVVLMPLFVYGMSVVFPLEQPFMVGVLLYGIASGAPYTPRLVSVAGADVASSIGSTMLLTVLTIAYMPIVLPWIIPGTEIGVWAIAKPLLLQMFVPLVVGLGIRSASARAAAALLRPANVIVNLSALVFLVLALVLHREALLDTLGTGAVSSAVALTVAGFVLGFALGPRGARPRVTLGLVTTARNIGAAATVATANFGDEPRVLITIAVCMFVVFALAFPAAKLYFKQRLDGGA